MDPQNQPQQPRPDGLSRPAGGPTPQPAPTAPVPAPAPVQPAPVAQPGVPAQPASPQQPAPTGFQPAQPRTWPDPSAAPAQRPVDRANAVNPIAEVLHPTEKYHAGEAEPEDAIGNVADGFKTILVGVLSWVVFPVAIVLVLHNFVFQAYHVLGTSMVPTLQDTDYLIVSKIGDTKANLSGKPYLPGRGEVIVFRFPQDTTKVFVKRVIGLPGDRVVVQNGKVTVYNAEHPEGFNPDKGYEAEDSQTLIDTDETVMPGKIFVMGDNRTPGGSYDSREWGQLESKYIIGDAVLRLLPLNNVKVF